MTSTPDHYFLPTPSRWPIIGSAGLFFFVIGLINIIHGNFMGHYFFFMGALLLAYMMFGWFGAVIQESLAGAYNPQVDASFRWGMVWFIFSEVAFFGVFFGALFYTRVISVPTLGGLLHGKFTHAVLWPQFEAHWPLFKTPNPALFPGPKEIIFTWGIPALNTLLLLSSAVAVTVALWGLKKNRHRQLLLGVAVTILLGLSFECMQAYEYMEAYTRLQLTLHSGIYGTTFFMLTGFHAAHVMIGLTMLIVIFMRCWKGHFDAKHHFAFEAVSWYWHFVDVVWLFLFVFVYWL